MALAYAEEVRARGGAILTGHKVVAIEERNGERLIRTSEGELLCRDLISCAGLYSDRIAAMTGAAGGVSRHRAARASNTPENQGKMRGTTT